MRGRTFCLASVTLAFSIVSTLAADLPYRKAPAYVAAPAATWTGFYAGLNAGVAFGDSSLNTTGTPFWSNPAGLLAGAPATANALAAAIASNASSSGSGFVGGGQLGYDFQFAPAFVLGFEADMQALSSSRRTASASSTTSFAPFGFPANSYSSTASFSQRLDYLGTVRGRIGYLATPSLLTYITGGLAYGGANVSSSFSLQQMFPGWTTTIVPPIFGTRSASKTVAGWTLGGGLEWMLGSHWSAKAEYLYYDLGTVSAPISLTQNVNVTTPWATATGQTSSRFDGHIIRVGVNYRFN